MGTQEDTGRGSVWRTLFFDVFSDARMKAAGWEPAVRSAEEYGALAGYAKELFSILAMDEADILRDSKGAPVTTNDVTDMFTYLWAVEAQFINCFATNRDGTRTDEYWEVLVETSDAFAHKFRFGLATKLVVAFLDEVEQRDKAERAAAHGAA